MGGVLNEEKLPLTEPLGRDNEERAETLWLSAEHF